MMPCSILFVLWKACRTCGREPFTSPQACEPKELDDGGAAHNGMLEAARNLAHSLLKREIEERLWKHPSHQLYIVGHSLGASVASLLGWLWRPSFPSLQVYAFAPACAMTLDLASSMHFVRSVVLGDDVVPRLSLGAVRDARHGVRALAVDKSMRQEAFERAKLNSSEDAQWLTSLAMRLRSGMTHSKLYPAGRIVYLRRRDDGAFVPEERSTAFFGEIVFSDRMLADHMPGCYASALLSLAKGTEVPPEVSSALPGSGHG